MGRSHESDCVEEMKLNLLIDTNERLSKGPGRRAANLMLGLSRIGVEYEICNDDYSFEWAVGLQGMKVNSRVEKMPSYCPIGPNCSHCANDNTDIRDKFTNYIVQSAWVEDFWRWTGPTNIVNKYKFYVWPASVDAEDFREASENRAPLVKALHYAKYQDQDNFGCAERIYKSHGHTFNVLKYGSYNFNELKEACRTAEYCVYNSCCEKSSNAMMEILACNIPVYVVDAKKWIGDDKFDRCTSAPHFDERCGMIGDRSGTGFGQFYENVKSGKYRPREFVLDGYTVEHGARRLVKIVEECHG